jgi:hypothetical protein
MYKLVVQLLDLNRTGNQVIQQLDSKHVSSVQEAFESFDGKEAFQVWLEITEELNKEIAAIEGAKYDKRES